MISTQAMIDQGVSLADLRQVAPEVADQVEAAAELGVDVEIPTASYATQLASTPLGARLQDHVRLAPDALSVADVVKVDKARKDLMRQIVKSTFDADEQRAADRFVDSVEAKQWREESDRIQNELATNIAAAAPQFKESEVQTQARLGATMVTRLAQNVGLTPERMATIAPKIFAPQETMREAETLAQLNLQDGRFARKEDSATVPVVRLDDSHQKDFKTIEELRRWLKSIVAPGEEVEIASTKQVVLFSNTGLKASTKRSREVGHTTSYQALRDLVRNAEYEGFEPKDGRHPNLGGQDVYFAGLMIGDRLFSVRLKFDVPSEFEKNLKSQHPDLSQEDLRYKDHKLSEIEIAPVIGRGEDESYRVHAGSLGLPTYMTTGATVKNADSRPPASVFNVSLGVLRGAVKPTSLKKGVLTQPGGGAVPRGSFDPRANTIKLTPNADLSTFAHEMSHWYLANLLELSKLEGVDVSVR